MAAGQQKRRLTAATLASCNTQEQHRAKKKKNPDISPSVLRMNPHISLEWQESHKKAMAKKEQAGLAWRHVLPFVEPPRQSQLRKHLADVVNVPGEIFQLENLEHVLSYEVWTTFLTESERKVLSQFLPKGLDVDSVVEPLLKGENLHFGNPSAEWGSLLCSGEAHPDAVIRRELDLESKMRSRCYELENYNKDMIEELQRMKEHCSGCQGPASIQKAMRSWRKLSDNSVSSHVNESYHLNDVYNVFGGTCSSSIGDEEFSTYDAQRPNDSQDQRLYDSNGKRVSVNMNKRKSSTNVSKDHDGSKMDKRMKQSGGSTKFKSINGVLGDMNMIKLEPAAALKDEENKLYKYWLQIARKDILIAFNAYRDRQSERHQLMKCIGQELVENQDLIDEDMGSERSASELKVYDSVDRTPETPVAVPVKSMKSFSPVEEQNSGGLASLNFNEAASESEESKSPFHSDDEVEGNLGAASGPACQEVLERIPSLNSHYEPGLADPELNSTQHPDREYIENHVENIGGASQGCSASGEDIVDTEKISDTFPGFLDRAKVEDGMIQAVSATQNVWLLENMENASYHSGSRDSDDAYDVVERSVRQPQVAERAGCMIDLEADIIQQDDLDAGFPRPPDTTVAIGHSSSLFGYSDRGQDGLISAEVLQQQSSGTHQLINGLKPEEMHYMITSSNQTAGFDYSRQLHVRQQQQQQQQQQQEQQQQGLLLQQQQHRQQEQQHYLVQRQDQEKELYRFMIQKDMYQYVDKLPNQQTYTPASNPLDWGIEPGRMLPFHTSTSGSMIDNQWRSSDSRNRLGWPGTEPPLSIPAQFSGGGSSGDAFNFLPQAWNGLNRPLPYESMGSNEYISARNYSGGAAPQDSEAQYRLSNGHFTYDTAQFNYVNPHDAAAPVGLNGGVSWMNVVPMAAGVNSELMHPSNRVHDPTISKQYLNPWNR